MTDQTKKHPADAPGRAAELTSRIRQGDRQALAEAVELYRPLIERYIRVRLRGSLRRLFDTGDVMGSVSRRLDWALYHEKLTINDSEHLAALIQRMVRNAVVDRHRLLARLEAVEGPDSVWASRFLSSQSHTEISDDRVDELLDQAFEALPDRRDRQILAMWMHGFDHAEIGDRLGLNATAVRQRWHRIRFRLKEAIH